MIQRNVSAALLEALADNPVVLLHGARQTGKSTLAEWLASGGHPARYLTLDDAAVLAAARGDPSGFIAGLEGPVVLDEVQRAPELFLAIKAVVDRDRSPGRFLLTGSANVMLLPRLSESLAGRMEILTLWPLSQGEIEGVKEGFIDAVFSDSLPNRTKNREDVSGLLARLLCGGYPVVHGRLSEARQKAWFGSYVTTILQRDVRDLANVEGLTALPRLLSLLAARAMSLLNLSELSRSIAIPQTTLKRYMALLETTFLIQTLPAWSGNLGKRLVKAPKLVLSDTGLMSQLLGLSKKRITMDANLLGPLLENFVVMELLKQVTWSRTQARLFHFRTQTGQEVDIVLEDPAGHLVGIEVKAGATVTTQDFKGLRTFAEATGRHFQRGVVLYTGTESVPFGPRLHALPVRALWSMGAKKG
ncbi:MAG: ATPase [Deltaproteobacteria bacterium RIFCSPLOWO2_12_FULL_57_22]|nr:MAG: ATPase [Deltaproteobacteria bacterium RIFCSPLOWO2_12_FULL_57_22]